MTDIEEVCNNLITKRELDKRRFFLIDLNNSDKNDFTLLKGEASIRIFPINYPYIPEDNRFLDNPIGICKHRFDGVREKLILDKLKLNKGEEKIKDVDLIKTLYLVVNQDFCERCLNADWHCPRCNIKIDVELNQYNRAKWVCHKCEIRFDNKQIKEYSTKERNRKESMILKYNDSLIPPFIEVDIKKGERKYIHAKTKKVIKVEKI